jgi:hypothetical protein
MPAICRLSYQNKFVKLVRLVGFIIKKRTCVILLVYFSIRHVQQKNVGITIEKIIKMNSEVRLKVFAIFSTVLQNE